MAPPTVLKIKVILGGKKKKRGAAYPFAARNSENVGACGGRELLHKWSVSNQAVFKTILQTRNSKVLVRKLLYLQ